MVALLKVWEEACMSYGLMRGQVHAEWCEGCGPGRWAGYDVVEPVPGAGLT